ncbi:2-dehydro-3-deoxygluconokinase [Jannaschia pagri]|uniref:2-dehydro-3-deoxygluconokinase n=1 Tax=Jannaschia pagri TaxID=2829797 RepID=A0ABQ4NJQ8_9RHOB|nr:MULTISPECIES: sugar kinase [unclassified Jannaschia]GIT90828.1 2-dehydro-3-deoxygluconokinase [Jannaschia sp. AI_61]GIT94660.1 2-dehydro-3-deoxygluconokinase [Jannaschia sp. AI_62]
MTLNGLMCIGEVMGELRRSAEGFALGFAGDTYNTAVYARRTTPQLRVDYATAIGEDPLSDGLLLAAKAEGIGTGLIHRTPERQIGLYSVTTDPKGERSFHYWRAASAARAMVPQVAASLAQSDHAILFLSGITLAILSPEDRATLIEALAAAPGRVAFDSNYRAALWEDVETAADCVAAIWRVTDIALPSLEDMQVLFGDDEGSALARLAAAGCRTGALKRGEAGPLALDGTAPGGCPPAPKVVDTTSAGDSFNGAYLATLLSGGTEQDALRAGHGMAAKVVQYPGAIIPAGV